jgi:hypothetical protein
MKKQKRPEPPARAYMISRFAELKKNREVESVKVIEGDDRFDVHFAGNVVLRLRASELKALKLEVSK